MDTATLATPPVLHPARGRAATMKLLLIGLLIVVLQVPVHLIHELEKDRKSGKFAAGDLKAL